MLVYEDLCVCMYYNTLRLAQLILAIRNRKNVGFDIAKSRFGARYIIISI